MNRNVGLKTRWGEQENKELKEEKKTENAGMRDKGSDEKMNEVC